MSNVYGVRSYGDPYFVLAQPELAFMDPLNAPSEGDSGSGSLEAHVRFSLDAMPPLIASADEVHLLFSYADFGPGVPYPDLAWIGITPSGRIAGGAMNGTPVRSQPGLVTPGRVYTAVLECSRNSLTESFDRVNLIDGPSQIGYPELFDSSVLTTRVYIVPSRFGQMLLLNGAKLTSRLPVTIYDAFVQGTTFATDPYSAHWAFDEQHGSTFAGPKQEAYPDNPVPFDFTLQAVADAPTSWPAIFGDAVPAAIGSHFRWYRKTPYTRLTRTKTQYVRI